MTSSLLEIAQPKIPAIKNVFVDAPSVTKAPTFDLFFPKQVFKNSKGKRARGPYTTSSAAPVNTAAMANIRQLVAKPEEAFSLMREKSGGTGG